MDDTTILPAFKGVFTAAAPKPAVPVAPQTSPTQPTAPQPKSGGPVTLQDGTQLDSGVVKVLHAIRGLETSGSQNPYAQPGDFVGGQATSTGAFQWNNNKKPLAPGQIPSHFQNDAKQYGLDPADFSPANQNKVAYAKIADQKAKGLTPIEIDALWNGAHVDSTTGKYAHNNPDRAVKFQQALSQEMQNSPAPQASLPPTQEESPSVGGFGGNVLKSGANFLGNLGEAVLHPINTIQNVGGAAVGGLQELGGQTNDNTAKFDALKDFFVERYKSPEALLHTAYTDPVGLAADISTLFGVGGGVVGLAGKAGKIAGLADAAETASNVASKLGRASELTNPLTPVIKGTGAVLRAGAGTGKNIASQFTEISPHGMEDIYRNPGTYTPEAIANTSRIQVAKQVEEALAKREADLSETGAGYEPIRNGTSEGTGVLKGGGNVIPVAHDFLENQLRTVAQLEVKDGKILPTTVSKVGKTEVAKLQDVLDTFKPAFQSGHISPEEFLTLRGRLADAAYNESGIKNTRVAKIAEDIRNELNTTYRPSIPGLNELDANYSAQRAELSTLRKGFIDKEGNLTQTAISKIANAGNKDLELARLEQLVPGITRQLTALKIMEEIRSASGIKVGTYAKSITEAGGAVAGITTGNIPLLAGSLTIAMLTSPKVVVPLIRFLGENKELIPAVMANLAKYATANSNLSQAASQTTTPDQQIPPNTQTTLPDASPSAAPNLSFSSPNTTTVR